MCETPRYYLNPGTQLGTSIMATLRPDNPQTAAEIDDHEDNRAQVPTPRKINPTPYGTPSKFIRPSRPSRQKCRKSKQRRRKSKRKKSRKSRKSKKSRR